MQALLGAFDLSSADRPNLQLMMFFLVLSHGIKKGVITPKTMQQLGITAEPQRHGPLAVVASISQKSATA